MLVMFRAIISSRLSTLLVLSDAAPVPAELGKLSPIFQLVAIICTLHVLVKLVPRQHYSVHFLSLGGKVMFQRSSGRQGSWLLPGVAIALLLGCGVACAQSR